MLKELLNIEREEIKIVSASFLFAFSLMTAYYLIRPVRDALSSDWLDHELSLLFTGTFVISVLVTALYGLLCSQFSLRKVLQGIYCFFAISFFSFYLVISTGGWQDVVAKSFYIWVSVFSLFQISAFWAFMAEVFSRKQAERLFGLIAAGSSVGAVAGPTVTFFLVESLGRYNLVLFASALLLVPMIMIPYVYRFHAHDSINTEKQSLDDHIAGSPLSGFTLFLKDPYLLFIAVFIFLYTLAGTFVYFELKNLMVDIDSVERTKIWSAIDLVVNVFSLIIAIFFTGRITRKMGVSFTLAVIPALLLIGFMGVMFLPVLSLVIVIQCVRRIGNYAITKPAREMLFTVLTREKKFKAKSVIDNVVYRGGDVIAAWLFTAITQGLSAGIVFAAGVGAAITFLWAYVGFWLGRAYLGQEAGSVAEKFDDIKDIQTKLDEPDDV